MNSMIAYAVYWWEDQYERDSTLDDIFSTKESAFAHGEKIYAQENIKGVEVTMIKITENGSETLKRMYKGEKE